MKLTQIKSHKRKAGMTLLELTVVILVLLSLISILFVGARAWKKGSDRSANIMNIRNVQQAVRGHQNMNSMADGAALASTVIFPDYMKTPAIPVVGLTYTYGTVIPVAGTLYLTVGGTDAAVYAPTAGSYADW
jgi:type II secretory pathway pseudopilin PulG